MVESSGLLNRRRVIKLYRGFESPPLRHPNRQRWHVASVKRLASARGTPLPLKSPLFLKLRSSRLLVHSYVAGFRTFWPTHRRPLRVLSTRE